MKAQRSLLLVLLPALVACAASSGDGPSSQARPLDPTPGAAGIGDPYYPLVGNGGYDVQDYDLRLAVDMETGVLQGRATIEALATQDLSSFHLDLTGLEVSAVTVHGEEAAFEQDGGELIITPARPTRLGSPFQVVVDYQGRPEPVPDPGVPFAPGVGWMTTDSGVYVISECIGASSWFPCNDHPLDKATYTIGVTVDEPWVTAANGLLVSETRADGQVTTIWRSNDPMATYLVTVNIADFALQLEEGPGGMPLRLYHPTDATEEELAEFARTAEMIEYFTDLFGPYPYECFGGVISYERIGGALETQTLPVYSRGSSEGVLAHELAHMWYGDSVSPAAWADLWLNEGFATYAGWLWTERNEGSDAVAERAAQTYGFLRQAQVGSPADPGLDELFGPRAYVRGAFVLHGLRGEVGDEIFFRILKAWATDKHDGNGSTAEFVAHAAKVSGRDLSAFFDDWLFAPVLPRLDRFEPSEGPSGER